MSKDVANTPRKTVRGVILDVKPLKNTGKWNMIKVKFGIKPLSVLILRYIEHIDKPPRLKQIPDFEKGVYNIGDEIDVTYDVGTMSIIHVANHKLYK